MSSRDKRKWIHKSYFNILEKIGYTTNTTSSDDTISQLIVAFGLFAVLSIFFIVLTTLPGELKDIGIRAEFIKFILNILTSPITQLTGIFLSFDMIKKIISKEVKTLERQFPKRQDVDDLNQEISKLNTKNKDLVKESSDSKMREEQLLMNLVRLYEVVPNDMILEIIMKDKALQKRWEIFSDTKKILSDAKEKHTKWESRKNLGAVIRTIKKESWEGFAREATLYALEIEDEKHNLASGSPEYLLCKDIYIYLYAWLVNSIDNSIAIDIVYMPIDRIGLRYPSKQSPDIDKYERAFLFLISVFDSGKFYIGVKDIQPLTTEQIDICKEGVSFYLKKLIEMLNDFEPPSR